MMWCVVNKFANKLHMCVQTRKVNKFRNDKHKNKQGRRAEAKAHAKVKQMKRQTVFFFPPFLFFGWFEQTIKNIKLKDRLVETYETVGALTLNCRETAKNSETVNREINREKKKSAWCIVTLCLCSCVSLQVIIEIFFVSFQKTTLVNFKSSHIAKQSRRLTSTNAVSICL